MSDRLPGGAPSLVGISHYVSHYASMDPHREALVWGAERWTYRELDRAADEFARALLAAGVRPGDRVAMLTTPRPEFVLVLLGTFRAGAIWVGVNSKYRSREVIAILEDADPAVFVCLVDRDEANSFDLKTAVPRPTGRRRLLVSFPFKAAGAITIDQFLKRGRTPQPLPQQAVRETAAAIIYTSGTTGTPKGAVLSHGNFIYSYEAVSRSFEGLEELRDNLRMLCNLPPNHIGCLSEMVGNTVIRGGTLIFNDHFDAALVLRTIREERVSMFGGVPAMLALIVGHPDFPSADLSSVRAIGWGGAPAPDDLVDRLMAIGAHLFTNYGLTEGGAVITATPPRYDREVLARTIGAPTQHQEARIVVNERLAGVGEAGDIQVRGNGVFLGYWNNPEASAAAVTHDGWLITGDVAWSRPDGLWELHGRRGEMFKSGGYNVYPREVELALEEHPGVSLAAVIGMPDALYFEVGHAFISAVSNYNLSEEEIIEFLRTRLAAYKVPKRIQLLREMPMLPIEKIDKGALRTLATAS